MAKPPLVDWNDGSFYREELDYRGHERLRVVFGYLLATLVVIAFVLLISLPGQS